MFMRQEISRRHFLKTTATVGAGAGLLYGAGSHLLAAETATGAPHAAKLGWRLGIQAWTFRQVSLFEAIDKTASLGLKYIEPFVGQRLSPDHPTAKFCAAMPADLRTATKKKLADSGLTMLGYYDVGPFREIFEFCKDMGIEMLISDPPEGAYGYHFDAVDRLCEDYGLTLALTNHPKPAPYWNPDIVLRVCNGRSKRIAASGDIGHWVREKLNPTECVKKLAERLVHFHFRDMNRYGEDTRDVPLGTGMCDIQGLLAWLHRKEMQPLFMLEFSDSGSLAELAQSIKFFDATADTLADQGRA
jgi:sugar phosphate isomerase/epimerase